MLWSCQSRDQQCWLLPFNKPVSCQWQRSRYFVNVTVSTHTKTQKWRRKLVQWLLFLQVCVWGVSINCGPSITHSFHENKTTKFLLKSLQAFLQNFAVSKLSCYTVIKTLVSTSCWLTSLRDQLLICKGTGKVKDCFVRERIAKGLRGSVQGKLKIAL